MFIMKDEAFYKEWEDIILINIMPLYSFDVLQEYTGICDKLSQLIENIFSTLKRLKCKVYNNKEIETIFMLIREDIATLNDILWKMFHTATKPVYEVILNIFEELILLCEDLTYFEICANLLKIRDFWFNKYKITIVNEIEE